MLQQVISLALLLLFLLTRLQQVLLMKILLEHFQTLVVHTYLIQMVSSLEKYKLAMLQQMTILVLQLQYQILELQLVHMGKILQVVMPVVLIYLTYMVISQPRYKQVMPKQVIILEVQQLLQILELQQVHGMRILLVVMLVRLMYLGTFITHTILYLGQKLD